MKRRQNRRHKLPRSCRIAVMLNESELRAIDNYCRRYNYRNRSMFIRQTVLQKVLHRMAEDSPTLFD